MRNESFRWARFDGYAEGMFRFFKLATAAAIARSACAGRVAVDHIAQRSIFDRLPPEDQRELLGHVQVFSRRRISSGCGGLQLTDEIRATIATQACLLLLHRRTDYYPRLVTIQSIRRFSRWRRKRHLEGHIWSEAGKIGLARPGARWDRWFGLGCREIGRDGPVGRQEPGAA